MKLRSRAVAAGLTAALTFSTCMPVAWAVPAASLEEASQRLETYGSELAALQDELAAKTSDLEMTSYHIGEKQAAIDATQEQLIVAKNVLAGRMRSSYKAGPSTLLQVLLGADSLDDIVSRIYYMDKVSSSDAQAIANVRNLEATLKTEKGELEQIRAEEQKAVDDLQVQVDDYTVKLDEAKAYYESLDAQIKQQVAEQQAAAANANVAVALETITPQEAPAAPAATQEEAVASETQEGESETSGNTSSGSSSTSRASSGGGLGTAYAAIGSPYVYGADGPDSFDCSGLVCYCYGYGRGRTTYDMIDSLQSDGSWKSSMSELSAGDLVFTDYGHVGIYLGDGTMIHAPTPGRTVCTTTVWSCIGGGTF